MEEKEIKPIKGIVKALGEFQHECPAISKEKTAGSGNFKYKYGSLPMILETIKPHMKKAGLAFTQPIVSIDGKEFINTTLFDMKTGESIVSSLELPDIKFNGMNELQSKGSAITYLRRYSIMSILGIVTEEDDNDAQGKTEPKAKAQSRQNPATEEAPWLNPIVGGDTNPAWNEALKYLADGGKISDIKKKYKIGKANEDKLLNDSLNYDDLPFDREATQDPDKQSNMNFDNQG